MSWLFYLCVSGNGQQSYTGITKHPERRLRQHRGEIKGGARWPLCWKSGCSYALHVTGFPTPKAVRSFELHTKTKWRSRWKLDTALREWLRSQNITMRRFAGPLYRIYAILHLLSLPKWKEMNLQLEWKNAHYKKIVTSTTKNESSMEMVG